MSRTKKIALKLAVGAVVLGALGWLFVRTIFETNRGPYDVAAAALSGWTVVAGDPGEPGAVALLPPAQLHGELFRQLFQRTMRSLTAPGRPTVPLVLHSEFADSLQGVVTIEHIMRVARDAGIETARFEAVCMGHLSDTAPGSSHELFYALFDAPLFVEIRRQLSPLHPELAGTIAFQPAALRPILTIAASDGAYARWWPMTLEQQSDCEAPLRAR